MDRILCVLCVYSDGKLQPGAVMSDHSDSFRQAFGINYPQAEFGQCWPHIRRKWGEGAYCSKTWEHFNEAGSHLDLIHHCITLPMRQLVVEVGYAVSYAYLFMYPTHIIRDTRILTVSYTCIRHVSYTHLTVYILCLVFQEVGGLWDDWGKQMNTFWNSYCVDPWNNWSLTFSCELCRPCQQAQESWHGLLMKTKIPNGLRGSTEFVFQQTIPDLIELDAIQLPNILQFSVPCIPKPMLEKAKW